MFLIKIPKEYPNVSQIEKSFKDLFLAYTIELSPMDKEPSVVEGSKVHKGVKEIEKLIEELQDYYSADYNCSCAR